MARDDDDGQVDGDDAPSPFIAPGQPGSPFAATFGAQPWLRGAQPPWHMWGNTERFGPVSPGTPSQTNLIQGRQLTRVSYKRPDTWHWLFLAQLIEAPGAPGLNGSWLVSVDYDITVGIGRSSVTMPSFERLSWTWSGSGVAPTAFPIWSTSADSPPPTYAFLNGLPVASQATRRIDQIVAQDIQVNCRVQFTAIDEPTGGGTAALEVSAYWSPKTHIRPDWHMRAVPEAVFPGDEIGGR